MHERLTQSLEGSPTIASLAPHAAGLVPAPDCRSPERQRRGRQPMDSAASQGGPGGPQAPRPPRCSVPVDRRPMGSLASTLAPWGRSLRLAGPSLDLRTDRRGHSPGVWHLLPSRPCGPTAQSHRLEPTKAGAARPPTRRSRHGALARGHLASPQKGAQVQQHTILFLDESGFSPLPRVVRTDAPAGPTPVWREWWTRDPRSAISAMSPAGTLSCSCQGRAIHAEDVVAVLEPLLRAVPRRMSITWEGAPIHRSRVTQGLLANGAAHRVHLARLPAYAPELNPGEGRWAHLNRVALRHVWCFNLPHRCAERRDAVKRVRRKPRLIKAFFSGAHL